MGRRKSNRKPPPKKSAGKLDTIFPCPFCNHEDSCEVIMRLKQKVGVVTCKICGESFQTPIHHLSEPIDVYTDWIDECEAANAEDAEERAQARAPAADDNDDDYGYSAASNRRATDRSTNMVLEAAEDDDEDDFDFPEVNL
eukprot:TRINITY_DN4486_c0_g1_i2.p1 TRINITY_DN4486_c0_g1~~TRINITY_DN4486_c0_g1_i2.p1  ORF type:complete len:141 (+),score=24.12 TRINITY_DN4486_c0_g1_i2:54-476(+)